MVYCSDIVMTNVFEVRHWDNKEGLPPRYGAGDELI